MTRLKDLRRLVFVVPSARLEGGGDVWLDQLLRHFPALDTQPLAVFEEHGELETAAVGYGCDVAVLAGPDVDRSDPARLVAPLASVLKSYRPEVSVFWSPRAQLYGAQAHEAAGRPGRTAWVQHVLPSEFWLHREASLLPSDVVVCVSEAVQRLQGRLYPGRATRVVHPGVDAVSSAPRRGRERRPGRVVIGVVGRVEPWKGQDVAVRALAVLTDAGVDAQLLLLGQRVSGTWPAFAGEVEDLVRGLGLGSRVTFTGHLQDVVEALAGLDVLVCASREEGFGLAIVEAMRAGVPVVATRCGGPEDIIDHGRTGVLVAPEDPAALATAICGVPEKPNVAARLARNAEVAWRTRFTGAVSAAAFHAVLSELSSGG